MEQRFEYQNIKKTYKVVVIGDATVGKTSFIRHYVTGRYEQIYKATIGVDFAIKIIPEKDIKIQLWDIAGQDRYTWMTRVYYKGCSAAIILFDLSNKASLLSSIKWKKDLDSKCFSSDGHCIPCILLGNKADLPPDRLKVKADEVNRIAQENNFIGWSEISVKEGVMINESVNHLIEKMLDREFAANNNLTLNNSILLSEQTTDSKKCCDYG